MLTTNKWQLTAQKYQDKLLVDLLQFLAIPSVLDPQTATFQRRGLKGNVIPNQASISNSFSYISLLLSTNNQYSLQEPWLQVWLRRFS